ncbi:MAG: hypothetical protein WC849_01670 [Candidatus Paceibacterota bacterium]
MSWSERKKTKYILVIFLIIILLFVLIFVDLKGATCDDGKRNQDEEGIDCGGSCPNICSFSTEELIIKWSRAFLVKDGIYNAVAYVENPNVGLETKQISYVFKLYDETGLLVYERKGFADIPAQRIIPIFEETIQTGNREVKRTTFEFASLPKWEKIKEEPINLGVENISIKSQNGFTNLQADLYNPSVYKIEKIKVMSVLFDTDGNALNSSKTELDFVNKDSKEKMVFTWPSEFADSVAKIEIIPLDYLILK